MAILIVEDSKMFSTLLSGKIQSEIGVPVLSADCFAEAQKVMEEHGAEISIALLDLNLPDAEHGEIVDLALSKDIPSIVFTAQLSDEVRDHIWSKRIVDYVLKEGMHNVDYLVSMLGRILNNAKTKILVVDDSKVAREKISELLRIHKFSVLEAANGTDALRILEKNPEIKLVITDYTMPGMDGFELTKQIRKNHSKEDMGVIGISAYGNPLVSAKFIKHGANDYLNKPVIAEEFYCRVNQNLEMLELVERIRDSANRDYLTKLFNRRYFFDLGRPLHANAKRHQTPLSVAMVDIDFFKKINDTYGHDAGDKALVHMAGILRSRFRGSDIVARFGGEEFCILAPEMKYDKILEVFEGLRKAIEASPAVCDGTTIPFTVSIGLCARMEDTLEEMINQADSMLYKAKHSGRNKVMMGS
jgi:diguanylate cyclase (GGDEF)-like protein